MKIAVEGCMHGDLDGVYSTLLYTQKVNNIKIDLLICCGDFQAVRNAKDLESMNVPPKYKEMNSFWKYYSGAKVVPIPTIFIGGNHEASNYLWELYYGGWAAPGMYFLGFAGVVKFGNVRIGGISGIYKPNHYYSGHYEKLPLNEQDVRSIYHVREYDVYKLMQVQEPIDIFLSHDWPLGITDHGDVRTLLRQKDHFKKDIRENKLGSPACAELLAKLKPTYWFAGHLHCKFPALVQHEDDAGSVTKFLALDKCEIGRSFLQIFEFETVPGPYELHYDEEWLAITKKFNPIFPRTRSNAKFREAKLDIEECRKFVRTKMEMRNKPFEFVRTAPCHNPSRFVGQCFGSGHHQNPQTEAFIQHLELQHFLDNPTESVEPSKRSASFPNRGSVAYKNEDIPIDDVEDE